MALYTGLAIMIDISNVVVNFCLAFVLKKLDKLRIASYWFIFWLSLSDFSVGMTGLYYDIRIPVKTVHERNYSEYKAMFFFLQSSGFLTTTIAVDRCFHMKMLNKYSIFMTRRKCYSILLFNILLSASFSAMFLLCPPFFVSIYLGAFFFSLIIYIRTYTLVKNRVFKADAKSEHWEKGQNYRSSRCCIEKFNPNNVTAKENFIGSNQAAKLQDTQSNDDECKVTPLQSDNLERKSTASTEAKKSEDNETDIANHSTANKVVIKITCPGERNKDERRRPENELGKAIICLLCGYSVFYIPMCIINLYNYWSPGAFSLSTLVHLRLLLNCNCSFNAIILLSFSTELRNYFKTQLTQSITYVDNLIFP
ncbi:uncharacterized protein LOC135685492 [Rhopilema esculentum]|uniref:uncharacterized protein LOC135685492 n=1 Tax=Rhopilema esculentum TaxID=499914 RepID=UPI0031D7DE04